MLTTSSNLLVFHMLRGSLQDKLFHHFSRDGDETEWSAVSQALLDICLLPQSPLLIAMTFQR